jgi:hypothetical protein
MQKKNVKSISGYSPDYDLSYQAIYSQTPTGATIPLLTLPDFR